MSSSKRRGRSLSHDYVAGNGLINRRALLGQGFAIAGAVGAAGTVTGAAAEPLIDAPWGLEVGAITPPVQTPSPFEKNVVRALSNPNGEFRTSHARTPHQLLGETRRLARHWSKSVGATTSATQRFRGSTRASTICDHWQISRACG